jgi:hypothetical protein
MRRRLDWPAAFRRWRGYAFRGAKASGRASGGTLSTARDDERQHREDVVEAGRFGEEFRFGQVKTVARITVRLGTGQLVGGVSLVTAGLVAALTVLLARIAAAPRLIVVAAAAGAALLGWQLIRSGSRPRAENRLYMYPGGLIQLVHAEPEPRVLRWEDLDSAEIGFDSISEDSATGLDTCALRGSTGTEITVRADMRRFRWIPRQLAAEADRVLSARLIPQLIEAYEAGEPVVFGQARIDQAGVAVGFSRFTTAAWTDITGVLIRYNVRSGFNVPAESVWFDRANRKGSIALGISGVRNGILVPHLIEHIAAQHGIPVRRSGP